MAFEIPWTIAAIKEKKKRKKQYHIYGALAHLALASCLHGNVDATHDKVQDTN